MSMFTFSMLSRTRMPIDVVFWGWVETISQKTIRHLAKVNPSWWISGVPVSSNCIVLHCCCLSGVIDLRYTVHWPVSPMISSIVLEQVEAANQLQINRTQFFWQGDYLTVSHSPRRRLTESFFSFYFVRRCSKSPMAWWEAHVLDKSVFFYTPVPSGKLT